MLQLSVGFNSHTITVETKADADTDSCKVQIKNSEGGILHKFNKVADIPAELWLIAGKYTVEASTGTPKAAEFDKPYYNGKEEITIQANKASKHEITCRLSQSKVSVVYSNNLKTYYTTYSTVVSMGTSKLEFKKDSTKIGYFYAPDGDKDLLCKVNATNNQSENVSAEYTIKNIQPYTHYIVNVDISNADDGGLKFTIEVDETTDEKNDNVNVNIKAYPKIKAQQDGLETSDFVYFEDPANGSYTLKASAALGLKEFTVNNPYLSDVLGGKTSVNFMNLSSNELTDLTNRGFSFTPTPAKGIQELTVNIPVKTASAKAKENFVVSVVDTHDQKREGTYSMFISDMKIATDWPQNDEGAWATQAILQGRWFTASPPADIKIRYKKESETNWTDVPDADVQYDMLTKRFWAKVSVTPSENGTVYQYTLSEGGKTSDPQTFVTEKAMQVPNSNFNTWTDNDHSPFTSGNKWWDTANGGTSLMSKYPTVAERTDVKEGDAAAKLTSIDLGIKFAAGNIYTGEFDKVDMGSMGATLYFGKPYTSRPTKLTGWYKYTSGQVKTANANPSYIAAGGYDLGSIQIALCYWPDKPEGHFMNTSKPETFINFSKSNASIIAYGSVPDADISSTMTAYQSFEIKLKYRDLTKKPTHIVIIGSASKYGDYFVGSEESVLLLDDFQLVFDDEIIEDL